MLHRILAPDVRSSFFLFGPRQTGKTTLIKSWLGPDDLYINLLPQRAFLAYANEPGRFREEVLAHVRQRPGARIFVDEIQKVPALLDEVHDLIEAHRLRFVLTGSSARRLRRSEVNLLAGRAYTYRLHPLTVAELGDAFDLERALRVGCLPALWDTERQADPREFLTAYADTYLREEIASEGVVKDLAPIARFLDVAAANDGEVINFSAFARECGVSVKTAQAYFQILEDTFLAFRVPAWTTSARKRLVVHPRFYLFDPGVTNALSHTLGDPLSAIVRGRRFEQLVVLQLLAAIEYARLDLSVHFWRTQTGHEVDVVLARGPRVLAGVEIKSVERLEPMSLRGLRAFREDHPDALACVVGPFERRRDLQDGVEVWPWREFLDRALPGLCREPHQA